MDDKQREEQQIQSVVQEWTGILLDTRPMDRAAAEKSVLELYRAAGLKCPMDARVPSERDAGPEIIYCQSVRGYVKLAMEFAEKIKGTDEAARKFTESAAKSAASTPWSDGNWLAADDYYCRYSAKEDEKTKEHPIQHLKAFARAGFALATFEKVAFIIERPCKIVQRKNDEQLQWHCVDGPVLEWPDGEKLYAIEGFFCDEQLVMHPETQSMDQIHNEQNLELRRIRIERMGWEQYLERSKATVIDKRRNDVDGGCYEALCSVPDLDARVLLCTCPTGRVFNLLVPVSAATCVDAKKYLVGDPRLTEIGRT